MQVKQMKKYVRKQPKKSSCKNCGLEFLIYGSYLKKTCSKKCEVETRKKTNLQKYGHEVNLHGSQKEELKQKIKDKYGVDNISQIPELKEKKRQTCQENFGVDWPMQSAEIRRKSIETLLREFGTDNISKVPEIIQKIQNALHTPKEEYNGLTPFEYGAKIKKERNLRLYGVEFYFQTEEFKEKYRAICTKKFGVDNIFKSEKFDILMKEKGIRYSNNDLLNRNNYHREVNKYTRRSLACYGDTLQNNNKNDTVEYDHIFSRSQGFKQKVPPEIIGSIVNLQIIPKIVNRAKGDSCWITKDILIERYEHFMKSIGTTTDGDEI